MKKSLIAAATLAVLSFSGTASALDTNEVRQMRSSGLPVQSLLGTLTFTALGAQGQYCTYLMTWESPFNPNDVELCILRERRTPVYPSCITNSLQDITTFVSAGPGAQGGSTYCAGFDTLGISYDNVTLLTGEFSAEPILQGVAVFPTAIPLVHSIEVA